MSVEKQDWFEAFDKIMESQFRPMGSRFNVSRFKYDHNDLLADESNPENWEQLPYIRKKMTAEEVYQSLVEQKPMGGLFCLQLEVSSSGRGYEEHGSPQVFLIETDYEPPEEEEEEEEEYEMNSAFDDYPSNIPEDAFEIGSKPMQELRAAQRDFLEHGREERRELEEAFRIREEELKSMLEIQRHEMKELQEQKESEGLTHFLRDEIQDKKNEIESKELELSELRRHLEVEKESIRHRLDEQQQRYEEKMAALVREHEREMEKMQRNAEDEKARQREQYDILQQKNARSSEEAAANMSQLFANIMQADRERAREDQLRREQEAKDKMEEHRLRLEREMAEARLQYEKELEERRLEREQKAEERRLEIEAQKLENERIRQEKEDRRQREEENRRQNQEIQQRLADSKDEMSKLLMSHILQANNASSDPQLELLKQQLEEQKQENRRQQERYERELEEKRRKQEMDEMERRHQEQMDAIINRLESMQTKDESASEMSVKDPVSQLIDTAENFKRLSALFGADTSGIPFLGNMSSDDDSSESTGNSNDMLKGIMTQAVGSLMSTFTANKGQSGQEEELPPPPAVSPAPVAVAPPVQPMRQPRAVAMNPAVEQQRRRPQMPMGSRQPMPNPQTQQRPPQQRPGFVPPHLRRQAQKPMPQQPHPLDSNPQPPVAVPNQMGFVPPHLRRQAQPIPKVGQDMVQEEQSIAQSTPTLGTPYAPKEESVPDENKKGENESMSSNSMTEIYQKIENAIVAQKTPQEIVDSLTESEKTQVKGFPKFLVKTVISQSPHPQTKANPAIVDEAINILFS